MVGGKQGHAPCKILLLQQILLLVSVGFHGDYETVTEVSLVTLRFGGFGRSARPSASQCIVPALPSWSSCPTSYTLWLGLWAHNLQYIIELVARGKQHVIPVLYVSKHILSYGSPIFIELIRLPENLGEYGHPCLLR